MQSSRSQARRALSDGLVVERLPLGFAAGRWWATFVYAVPGWDSDQPPVDWRRMGMRAFVGHPDDLLDCVAGGGGGGEREYDHTWELVDHGAQTAEVTYVEDGHDLGGGEVLALDRADRSGYFTVRLADGSLIERLPIGHAHGRWRLQWVRSDVPRAEIEAAMADEDLDMPHERFLGLRPPRARSRWRASGTIGGPIQPFGVSVPDTIDHLEVDYRIGNTSAGSEVLPLPGVRR